MQVTPETSNRRDILLSEMDALDKQGVNCRACPGHCCTSVANSMQTTAMETLDVLTYLKNNGAWTQDLQFRLQTTVKKFGLDRDTPGNGRRSYLRRTYDCPFFAGQNLGCTLPKEVKPYGCLGFNPRVSGEAEGHSCLSNQRLLSQREENNPSEDGMNKKLQADLNLDWQKLPLPLALLRLGEKI